MSKGEFKEKCDSCLEEKKSRTYPIKKNNKWIWLCSDCWNEATK